MALAGGPEHVAILRERQGPLDRSTPIDLTGHCRSPGGTLCAGHSLHDLGDDRLRVLRARVVRGDEQHIGQRGPDRTHQRALAAIAIAAGAEYADHPAMTDFTG